MVSSTSGYSTSKMLLYLLLTTFLGFGSAFILHEKYGDEEPYHMPLDLENPRIIPILSTDKNEYSVGDSIQVEIGILNNESVKVELRSIEYDLTIYQTGREKIYWVKVYNEFTKPVLVDPNTVYQIPIGQTWKQRDMMNQQVPWGTYVIKVKFSPYNLTTTKNIVIEEESR